MDSIIDIHYVDVHTEMITPIRYIKRCYIKTDLVPVFWKIIQGSDVHVFAENTDDDIKQYSCELGNGVGWGWGIEGEGCWGGVGWGRWWANTMIHDWGYFVFIFSVAFIGIIVLFDLRDLQDIIYFYGTRI